MGRKAIGQFEKCCELAQMPFKTKHFPADCHGRKRPRNDISFGALQNLNRTINRNLGDGAVNEIADMLFVLFSCEDVGADASVRPCRHLRFVTAYVFSVGMVVKLAGSASGG